MHFDSSASAIQLGNDVGSKIDVPSSSSLKPPQISQSHSQLSVQAPFKGSKPVHGEHSSSSATGTSDSVRSKADSALAFLMSRSQVVEPSVQVLLNQVDRVSKIHADKKLAKILRPRPSHTFGTKRSLEKQIRRQSIRRKRQRGSGLTRGGVGGNVSEPVFRSSTAYEIRFQAFSAFPEGWRHWHPIRRVSQSHHRLRRVCHLLMMAISIGWSRRNLGQPPRKRRTPTGSILICQYLKVCPDVSLSFSL